MSKTKKTKNLLILIVLIAIVAIAVGYAAMAQNLTLNGTVNTLSAAEWNVHFVNGSATMSPAASEVHDDVYDQTFTLDSGLLSGTFTATLAPGASIEYTVQVINDGKLHAKVGEEATITGEGNGITCTVEKTASPTSENGELFTGNGTDTYKITVSCADSVTLPATATTANITVTFHYVQAH